MSQENEIFNLAIKLLKKAGWVQSSSPKYLEKYLEKVEINERDLIKKHGEEILLIISYYENFNSALMPLWISVYAITIPFLYFLAGPQLKSYTNDQYFIKLITMLIYTLIFFLAFVRFHVSKASVVKFAISFIMEKSGISTEPKDQPQKKF